MMKDEGRMQQATGAFFWTPCMQLSNKDNELYYYLITDFFSDWQMVLLSLIVTVVCFTNTTNLWSFVPLFRTHYDMMQENKTQRSTRSKEKT